MGQKPADIEREIAERRQAISNKLNTIDGRIRHDIDDVKSSFREDVEEMKSKVTSKIPERSEVTDKAGKVTETSDSYLRDHPGALIGAAVGAGFVLDRLFAGGDEGDSGRADRRGQGKGRRMAMPPVIQSSRSGSEGVQDDGSSLGGKLGMLSSIPGTSKLQDSISSFLYDVGEMLTEEAKRLMKDATDSIKSELSKKKDEASDVTSDSRMSGWAAGGDQPGAVTGSQREPVLSGANGQTDTGVGTPGNSHSTSR